MKTIRHCSHNSTKETAEVTMNRQENSAPRPADKGSDATRERNPIFVDMTGRRRRIIWLVCGIIAAIAIAFTEPLLRSVDSFLGVFNWILILAAGLVIFRLVVVEVCATHHLLAARRSPHLSQSSTFLGPVSIVVPAYNEEAGIEHTLRSLAASTHPELEIIVVDDGSTDRTVEIARGLEIPAVSIIQQPNSGKAAALNTGIAASHHEILILVDGDTVFEPDAVDHLVRPLIDPRIGAVSGNTKVGNRKGLIGRWQHVEYVVGFNLDRRMFELLECMPTVPGAIGAFRRQVLESVGGFSTDTLAEDTDITMAICRSGWRGVYQPRAIAWTEAPATFHQLWLQRYRWCYGTFQSAWKHRRALIERGPSGKLGRRGIMYIVLYQLLMPLLAPAVDIYTIYGLIFLDPVNVLIVWSIYTALQVASCGRALRLDGESLGTLWSVPLRHIVYRQLLYLVVIRSVFAAILGSRLHWHRLERHGSAGAARDSDRPAPREATRALTEPGSLWPIPRPGMIPAAPTSTSPSTTAPLGPERDRR
ncbi:glycosyltransferase family 2 protein [Kitasatospora sp. MBT63]|uniref:glycosyltransferase n=1 Tax=Kitasatospora sp. MBT63 TaxID=1444768 RepID=UPI0009EA950F|nr:glycosyltransferase family 2 protein [Kitasatospora sp. MBT63]